MNNQITALKRYQAVVPNSSFQEKTGGSTRRGEPLPDPFYHTQRFSQGLVISGSGRGRIEAKFKLGHCHILYFRWVQEVLRQLKKSTLPGPRIAGLGNQRQLHPGQQECRCANLAVAVRPPISDTPLLELEGTSN